MATPAAAVRNLFQRGQDQASAPGLSAGKIRARWDASQKATSKERQQFWINSAFLSDEQWVRWSTATNTLEEAPRDGDRLRLTENRLKPSSRTNIAKLLRRPLVFEVPPNAADDAAVDGSRTAAAVLADVHHRHNWEELRRQNAWQTWKGGVGVLCVEWDPKAGTPLGVTDTGRNFGTGDTIESALTVAEVAAEPGSRSLEMGRWWIKGAALPPRDVQAMYGLDEEPPADASAALSPLQRRLIGSSDTGQGGNIRLTLVLTYYERPNPQNKQGAVAIVVDNRIVEQGPWPFPFTDRLNCVAVRETPRDDLWTGETILSSAISPQVTLNHAISSRAEHMKLAGNARLAVPEGAGDEWDDLSDLPAEIVHYTPVGGASPEWLSPPQMPGWWIEAAQESRAAVDDILGVHQISRGGTEGGVTAATALQLLAEQDDTPLGMLSKEMAEAWGRLATLVLKVYEAKVTENRPATVERPGQAPEVVHWTGKDLASQTTAVVPLDAVSPRSQAAQLEMAFRIQAAFPTLDLKTFARIAALPDAADLTEATDPDVAKARRENGDMAAGNVVFLAPFDDHAKHISEHNVFRKSARYEALDQATRDIIDAHVQGHEVDGAREMGEQIAKASVNPALAAAPQANEPPMAGMPDAAAQMQQAQQQGAASVPPPPAEVGGNAMEGADGQSAAPQQGGM